MDTFEFQVIVYPCDIWLLLFDEFQNVNRYSFCSNFVQLDVRHLYDANVENSVVIITVMLPVKMFIVKCKYERWALCRIAFVRIFVHKMMLLRTYNNDIYFSNWPKCL